MMAHVDKEIKVRRRIKTNAVQGRNFNVAEKSSLMIRRASSRHRLLQRKC